MAKTYLRIPFNKSLEFPALCPFTGQANPKQSVFIWYPQWRFRIPIPVLEWIWWERTTQFRLPASTRVALVEQGLRWLRLLVWVGLILLVFVGDVYLPSKAQNPATQHLFKLAEGTIPAWKWITPIALAVLMLIKWLRLINLRAVKIVTADAISAEMGFVREDFAQQFAALNHFLCKREPFRERSRKVAGLPS